MMSGQRSKSLLFVISANETRLITAANPNFAKRLPNGLKNVAYKYGPYRY